MLPTLDPPSLLLSNVTSLRLYCSAEMLKDLGLDWVILGHSERRHIIKESDEVRWACSLIACWQWVGVWCRRIIKEFGVVSWNI